MSVYRKIVRGQPQEEYSYDFKIRGHRFSGSTGKTNERAAKIVEKRLKDEAKIKVKEMEERADAPWTVEEAMSVYVREMRGGELPAWERTYFGWLQRRVGKRLLSEINDAVVAGLVYDRSQEDTANATINKRKVSNTTVNTSVTKILRKVFKRAEKPHGQKAGTIDWSLHLKDEPEERIREASADEESKLFSSLREDFRPVFEFYLYTGVRLSEAIRLKWSNVNFEERTIWITGKGSKGRGPKTLPIPMPPHVAEILVSLRGLHPEFVFTYEVQSDRWNEKVGKKYVKGERRPLSKSYVQTQFRDALKDSGVTDFRLHDYRHTAATRLLRFSNLKVVQKLLRHTDIRTTMRYAHVIQDDVLDAMIKSGPKNGATKSPTQSPTQKKKASNS